MYNSLSGLEKYNVHKSNNLSSLEEFSNNLSGLEKYIQNQQPIGLANLELPVHGVMEYLMKNHAYMYIAHYK